MKPSSDPAILDELLALHHAPRGTVADMSWGLGKLWSRELLERYQPITVDLDPRKGAAIVGDWTHQSDYFAPASIATEIWDLPHISDAGATGLVGGRVGGWGERYGTRAPELKGPTAIIDLLEPFLASAWTSLEPGRGTLIVKIADQVRQRVLRFQPYWLWLLALTRGWHACDRYERRRAQVPHNTSQIQEHIRRGTTHWLVFHNFEGCPGEGRVVRRRCHGCDRMFAVRRRDQQTCGAAVCRQRLSRLNRTSTHPSVTVMPSPVGIRAVA